jgi:hypothetical protein
LRRHDIPESVTTLELGTKFNQPSKRYDIPESVTTLTFGFEFNQPLNHDLLNYRNIILDITTPQYFIDRYQVPILGNHSGYWAYENVKYSSIDPYDLYDQVNKIIYDITFRKAQRQGHALI